MKNKVVLIVVAVLVVVLIGVLVWFNYDKSFEGFDPEILVINSERVMSESDLVEYAEVKSLLNENPNDYGALLNLAILKQRMVDYDGAIAIYEDLRERKEDDIIPLQNLGSIYYDTKQYEKAEEMQLTILNEITYKWINSYRELMSIYRYHLKDRRESVKPLLEFAYENYPEAEDELSSMLAQYYDLFALDNAEALKYYEIFLGFHPEDAAVQKRVKELKN